LAAVEQHDFAVGRHPLVDAPEVVVFAFGLGGGLPAHGVHAQRAGAREHAAQRAVLARGVHALQHHQQAVAGVRIKKLLQLVDLGGQRFHGGLVGCFVAARERLGRRIKLGERHRSG